MFIFMIILGFFVLLIRAAGLLWLSIPLAYALMVPTLFHGWFYSHYELAYGIWYAMLAAVALSWVVTIIRRVREWF